VTRKIMFNLGCLALLSAVMSVTSVRASDPAPAMSPAGGSRADFSDEPARWWCNSDGGLSVSRSRSDRVSTDCATVRDFITEVNRYSPWKFIYTGPESAGTLGQDYLDPSSTSEVLRTLKRWRVEETSRDRQRHEIYLQATPEFEAKEGRRRLQVPAHVLYHLSVELPVRKGECRGFIQVDNGSFIWCRNVPLEQGLAAFSRRSGWQVVLAQPMQSRVCVSFLEEAANLDQLLRYLTDFKLQVKTRSAEQHRIVLTSEGEPSFSEPCGTEGMETGELLND
jgi:hypothetical protein